MYNNGGWYKNPATGRVQQYWNGAWYDTPVTGIVNGRNFEQNPMGTLPGDPGFKGTGSSSASTSNNPLSEVNKMIEDSYQKLQKEVIDRFGQYRAGQPFKVDQVLADKRNEAKEQIDPYYDQMLGDYLLGVTRKINRGVDDTKDLLSELTASTESYDINAKNSLADAIDKAQQSAVDSGLYGSGTALRTEGQITQGINSNVTDFDRQALLKKKQAGLGLSRGIEDINAAKKDYVSNLERSRFTDIETRIGDLAKEAGQQYIQGFQATLPSELQAASGFDMLKSLGIYS